MKSKPKHLYATYNMGKEKLEIIIPNKAHWVLTLTWAFFVLIFLFANISFLLEIFGLKIISSPGESLNYSFLFFLVTSFSSFFIVDIFIWTFKGKEIISSDMNNLKIEYTGTLLKKNKVYLKKNIENLRVEMDSEYIKIWGREVYDEAYSPYSEKLRFEYKNNIIKFGSIINEIEAKYILELLNDFTLGADIED